MKDLTVMIIDHDKMPEGIWVGLWNAGAVMYAAKFKGKSERKITDALDEIQEREY